jgi:hypothetical protein
MHSSISNSESVKAPRARLPWQTWALLFCALALCASAEVVARFGLRVSAIHRRIVQEAHDANYIRRSTTPSQKTVLLLGNSLLLEGVDIQQLRSGLQPRYQAQRFVVESTAFLDWYYALQGLFRHGMRADFIVLCLNPTQLTFDKIRGDFSAYMLFDAQDIWPASRDSGADLTQVSGYYLAHWSTFYGTRSELRSVFTYKLAHALPEMSRQAVLSVAVMPPDRQLIPQMEPRLRRFEELCNRYGAKFLFLIPPVPQSGDLAIVAAGANTGVRVLRPIPNGSLSLEYYRDGFHLNAKGAERFTSAIIGELMK